MRSFNGDLILIAAEFDNVERRKEVELVLGDYMAGVIMERQGVESEENPRDILKQYTTCPSWLALRFKHDRRSQHAMLEALAEEPSSAGLPIARLAFLGPKWNNSAKLLQSILDRCMKRNR